MAQVFSQKSENTLSVSLIQPSAVWCLVCAMASLSALFAGANLVSTLALCLFAASPGLFGGIWSWLRNQDPVTFSGHLDTALWVIVTSGLIALSGGDASPLAVMFVLPVLSCLMRADPVAAGMAALCAIPAYILAAASIRLGVVGTVADMQLLAMPLTLGTLAMMSLHVLGIANTMTRHDASTAASATRMSKVITVPGLPDDYASQEVMARYLKDRNEAINRAALAEQELRSCTDQIRHNTTSFSRRMRFFADLGLHMKTPLNIMTGFSEEIARAVVKSGNAQAAQYAAHIFHAGNSLRILVDNMEDIARITSGGYRLHHQEIDIDDMVAFAYRQLAEPAREKDVTLVPMAKCELIARVDRRALQQMVINLLGYCLNASQGQSARAGLWVRADNDHIQIGAYVTGHSENAQAIARKSRPVRVPSSDIPDSGLVVSRAFAELHGGSLSSSVRADGRFGVWVLLPAPDTSTGQVSGQSARSPAA